MLTIWPHNKKKKYRPLIDKLHNQLGWSDTVSSTYYFETKGKPLAVIYDILNRSVEHLSI